MTVIEHERVARAILADNGAPDPHPDLVADTVREVEYHGVPAAYAAQPGQMPQVPRPPGPEPAPMPQVERPPGPEPVPMPEWQVVREEYEMPCDHVACDMVHRHLYNGTYDRPTLIDVYDMRGEFVEARFETRFHVKQRVEWVILHHGVRVGNAHGTKREALAEMATRPKI